MTSLRQLAHGCCLEVHNLRRSHAFSYYDSALGDKLVYIMVRYIGIYLYAQGLSRQGYPYT